MTIERHVAFPLRISCNFLVYTPKDEWSEQKTAENVSQSKSSSSGASNHQNVNNESTAEGSTNPAASSVDQNPPDVQEAEEEAS